MARKRVVTTKPSRNGCSTCRIRRIKCDEARPHCHKCTSTGRQCDGYAPGLAASRLGTSARLLIPNGPWDSCSVPLLKTPNVIPSALRFNASELQALDFFRHEAANSMRRSLPASEWIQLALQLSLSEGPVSYAITALVRMLHAQDTVLFDMTLEKIQCMDYRPSMQQYNKAMAILRRYINEAIKYTATIEPVLVSCLLFVCFEILHGDGATAIEHLKFGESIIRDYIKSWDTQTRVLSSGLKVDSPQTVRQIVGLFTRLQHSTTALMPSRAFRDVHSLTSRPLIFTSLEEAKASLDLLIHSAKKLRAALMELAEDQLLAFYQHVPTLDQVARVCAIRCLARSGHLCVNEQTTKHLENLLNGHIAWSKSMRSYKKAKDVTVSKRLLFLEIQHFHSHLILSTYRTSASVAQHQDAHDFAPILDLIEQYLNLAAAHDLDVSESQTQRTYSLEMAVLPTLFLIACSSPSVILQDRAVNLLFTSGIIEAACESSIMGNIAAAIVRLRLRDSTDHVCGNDLEQTNFLEAVGSAHWQDIRIVCGRLAPGRDDELELREYEGSRYPLHLHLRTTHRISLKKEQSIGLIVDPELSAEQSSRGR